MDNTTLDIDFDAAFADFDKWRESLPEDRKAALNAGAEFSANHDADLKRWLSVGYVATKTGNPIQKVSEQFEAFYMPGFAKDERGLALPEAPKDALGFFDAVKGKAVQKQAENALYEGPGGLLDSALKHGLESDRFALNAWAEWSEANKGKPGYSDAANLRYREQALKIHNDARQRKVTLAPIADKVRKFLEFNFTDGPDAPDMSPDIGSAIADLQKLSPSDYEMVKLLISKGAKPVEKGAAQAAGEEAGRMLVNISRGGRDQFRKAFLALQETAMSAATDTVGAISDEARQRGNIEQDKLAAARRSIEIEEDLWRIAQGDIDPNIKPGDSIWRKMGVGGAGAVASTAPFALGGAGVAAMGLSYINDAEVDLRAMQEAKGIKATYAERMAYAVPVGIIQVALDKIGADFVLGLRTPLLKGTTAKITEWIAKGSGAERALKRGATGFVGENITEGLQDFTPILARDIANAISEKYPDVDYLEEGKRWMDQRADVFLAVLPLSLVGMGVSISNDRSLAQHFRDELAMRAHGIKREAIAQIQAQEGDLGAQTATFRTAWAERGEPDAEAIAKIEARSGADMQATAAAQELFDRQGYTLRRDGEGWSLRTPDGATVRAATAEEAVSLLQQDFSESQARNAQAVADMIDAFATQKRGGERWDSMPNQAEFLEAEGITSSAADRDAIVTAGRMEGLTEEEATSQVWAVLGSSTVEENEGVREAVSRIYRGGDAMTVVEETIEGRWKKGIKDGRYTPEQGAGWVRLAEQATGESYLPESHSERDLVEAISYIIKADVMGRARDGSRLAPGVVSRGLVAARKMGAAEAKEAGKFKAFLDSWREWAKRVFGTARKLSKARAEGKLDADFETLLDDLLGIDAQTRHEAGAVKIAEDWVNGDEMVYSPADSETFSLSSMATNDGAAQTNSASPSGLTEADVKRLQTSKIIDADGNPLLLHHGGDSKIVEWKQSQRGQLGAAYFTDSKRVALRYAIGGGVSQKSTAKLLKAAKAAAPNRKPVITRAFLDIKNPLDFTSWRAPTIANVIEQVGAKRLLSILRLDASTSYGRLEDKFQDSRDDEDQSFAEWLEENPDAAESEFSDWFVENDSDSLKDTPILAFLAGLHSSKDRKSLLDIFMDGGGYDGIVYNDAEAGGRTFVVREPSQIIVVKEDSFDSSAPALGAETFSLGRITPKQDADYMAAVEAGDMETAQRMVDAAAKNAGWSTDDYWRGVRGEYSEIIQSRKNSYVTDEEGIASEYAQQDGTIQRVYIPDGGNTLRLNNKKAETIAQELGVPYSPDEYLFEWLDRGKTRDALRNAGYTAVEFEDQTPQSLKPHNAVLIFDPNQIKSADPVTYDDAGNVIPLSQRFNEQDNRITYSLARRNLAAFADTKMAAMMKKPELKEAMFRVAAAKVAEIRQDQTVGYPALAGFRDGKPVYERRTTTREGMDAQAAATRTEASLKQEAKFIRQLRERELIEEGMGELTSATILTYERGVEALGDDPFISAMLAKGNLMSRTVAEKAGKLKTDGTGVAGDYNGAPSLPPSFYGGTIMPTEMADALYKEGALKDAYPDTLWEKLSTVINNHRKGGEAFNKARDAVREVEQNAKQQAAKESEKWLQEARAKVPTEKDRQMQALRLLDAILSAFPAEIRGRVGGFVKLASMGTDKAREAEIGRRLDKLDVELEKFAKKHFVSELDKLLEKVAPKGGGGEKAMGKIGVAGHRWFEIVNDALPLTEQQAQDEMVKLESILADAERESEHEAAFERWGILHQFGGFREKSAAEMETALETARDVASRGRAAWKAIMEERKAARVELQQGALKELGGKANWSKTQGKAAQEADKGQAEKMGDFMRRHFSFVQTLQRIFGRGPTAQRYENAARAATRKKTDAMIARIKNFKSGMMQAVGGKTWRETQAKLYELQQIQNNAPVRFFDEPTTKTLEVPGVIAARLAGGTMTPKAAGLTDAEAESVADEWAKSDNKNRVFDFKQRTLGAVQPTNDISQNQAIHFTMLAKQESYREAMDRHGITAETLEDLEKWLTPEAKAVRAWLFAQYDAGYYSLNEVYKRMFGIDLPRVKEYAPGYFEKEGASTAVDPFGSGVETTGLAAGFLKKRKNHQSRPEQVDALQAYWQHTQQTEHWKAWAELTGEMRSVLGNKEVIRTVKAKAGSGAAADLSNWIDILEQNGVKDAQANAVLAKVMRAQARTALAFKLGVLMKQLPATLGSLSDIGAKEWISSARRVLSGSSVMSAQEMFNTPTIQRRIESGYSPEMRVAMQGPNAKPDALGDVLEWGMERVAWTDAAFTSFSAAVAFDAHYRAAQAALGTGVSDVELRKVALEQTENTVGRTAQPGEVMDRSLVELQTQGFGKLMFMFQSAQRQAWALVHANVSGALQGQVPKSEAAKVVFTQFILIPAITQTMSGLIRYLFSDDEPEEAWKVEDYLRAMALGPSSGIMFMGAALDVIGSAYMQRSNNPLSNATSDVVRLVADMKAGRDVSANDIGSAVTGVAILLSGYVNPSVEAAGVTWSVLKQALGLADRVGGTE